MKILPNIVKISRHLKSYEIEAFSDCPICGTSVERPVVGLLQSDPTISLRKCPRCYVVSASHFPTQEYLADYYKDTFSQFYGLYNQAEEMDITFSSPERFVRHLGRVICFDNFSNYSSVKILDFGGGDGTLGLMLARKIREGIPITLTIIDYGESKVDPKDNQIEVIKKNSLDSIEGGADLVIASASLEHVQHVESVIKKLVGLLNPGGFFYARTPYIMPMKKWVNSIDFGYPAHIHDMGADFWNKFPEIFDENLTILKSRPSIVQLTFKTNALRCILAHLLKLPAKIECALFPKKKFLLWSFVGGWEIFLRKRSI